MITVTCITNCVDEFITYLYIGVVTGMLRKFVPVKQNFVELVNNNIINSLFRKTMTHTFLVRLKSYRY